MNAYLPLAVCFRAPAAQEWSRDGPPTEPRMQKPPRGADCAKTRGGCRPPPAEAGKTHGCAGAAKAGIAKAVGARGLLTALLLVMLVNSARADFKVTAVTPTLDVTSLSLDGSLDLSLTPKVEEALSKGIPIEVIVAMRLYRQRAFLWDENIAEWTLRRQIRYHALSGQYLISDVPGCPNEATPLSPSPLGETQTTPGDAKSAGAGCASDTGESVLSGMHESLTSLTEALKQLGSLSELKLPLAQTLPPEEAYSLELRVNLDIEALPAPLRPVAYTSLAWHLNSGWTTWKVQP